MELTPWQQVHFEEKCRQWLCARRAVDPAHQASVERFLHALTGPWPEEKKGLAAQE